MKSMKKPTVGSAAAVCLSGALIWIVASVALAGEVSDKLTDSPAAESADYRKVIARIQIRKDKLRDFAQQKQVASISRTLHSTGRLLITKQGVCWQTMSPVKTLMLMTEKGISTRRPGGEIVNQRAKDSREIEKIVSLMMSLFQADAPKLSRIFNISFRGDDRQWTLTFRPARREISRVLREVTLSGTRDVEKIVIREANGDVAEITVSEPSVGAVLSLGNCLE